MKRAICKLQNIVDKFGNGEVWNTEVDAADYLLFANIIKQF